MTNAHAVSSPLNNGANATVAANIRAALAYRALTQARLAEHLGLSEMSLSRRMKSSAEFTTSEVAAIARFFNLKPGELFEEKNLQITDWSLAPVTPIRPNMQPATDRDTPANVTWLPAHQSPHHA